jgi:trimeric autotransporter adhesin
LELRPNGSFTYKSKKDFSGVVRFVYRASDGKYQDQGATGRNIEALGRAERSTENMIGTKTERGTKVKASAFGFLVAALMVVMLLAAKPAPAATTFTVNSIGDGGDSAPSGVCNTAPFPVGTEPECTLRAAIEEANATTAADTINFNIGGSGVKTIKPTSSLPIITQPVTIDGYTEPGASENTLAVGNDAVLLIRLDGSNAGNAAGLNITANDSVVRGLSVTGFSSSAGLVLSGADNNRIEGNFLGTSPRGTQDLGNGWGLFIQSHFSDSSNSPSNNTVGGTSPETRNIISGNSTGVEITSGGGNEVLGNYIGTDKTGTSDLGNVSSGVSVSSQGANNTIGSNGAARNTIAFNGQDGVEISGAGSTGNRILGNSIFSNGGLGIDLGGDGRTANDPGDADTGANNLQNYPVITSAKTGRQATTIKGTLDSPLEGKNDTFTIQFFKNPESTREEGKKFIGERTGVTDTDGVIDGIISFTFKPPKKVKEGMFVTATATYIGSPTGDDTSEFSAPKRVQG